MRAKVWRISLFVASGLGLLCLGLGVLLPMMTVKKLVLLKNTFSVLGGIMALLHDKTLGLGLVLLLFSVIFPIVKFGLMAAYAWVYPDTHGLLSAWQSWFGKVAKFSMIDVFVIAQMLMILKLGWVVEVEIHSGIYWFSAAVLISIVMGIMIDVNIRQRLGHAH